MKTYLIPLAGLIASLGFGSLAQAVDFSGVTSATAIDPAGGAAIKYANPNWGTAFVVRNGGTFSSVSAATMTASAGVFILNFESAQGYGTASQSLNTNGGVFSGTSTIGPFTANDKINSITTSTGVTIGVEGRAFNTTSLTLAGANSNYGVFLVGDRVANDAMVSGTQGLTVGQYNGSNGSGAYLTFDQNLASFSVTLNAVSSGPTYYVALFDSGGSVVGTYTSGVAQGNVLYFGVSAAAANIRSVWIGQTTSTNALVIDDLAFVTAASLIPEPAATAFLLGGALLGAGWFFRRRRSG